MNSPASSGDPLYIVASCGWSERSQPKPSLAQGPNHEPVWGPPLHPPLPGGHDARSRLTGRPRRARGIDGIGASDIAHGLKACRRYRASCRWCASDLARVERVRSTRRPPPYPRNLGGEAQLPDFLQNPAKCGIWRKAHGSIRIQEGQPDSPVSVGYVRVAELRAWRPRDQFPAHARTSLIVLPPPVPSPASVTHACAS